MKREIEFRGFAGGDWIYGTTVNHEEGMDIWRMIEHGNELDEWLMVLHVGQYIGLKDSKGKKIYVGDTLKVYSEIEYVPNRDSGGGIIDYDQVEGFIQHGVVGFDGCSFSYKTLTTISGEHSEIHLPVDWLDNYEVIGTVYDKELDRL